MSRRIPSATRPAPAARFAVLLVLACLPWLATKEVAAADPGGSCTSSAGVLVAVDFARWGGDVRVGCDANPTTGYEALHAAGFTSTGTVHDGPAFVCRIDGYPTQAQDACSRTPPASAYWSYWHAGAGQNSWSYSTQGAMSYHPKPGSIDAWEFGAGNAPSFTPAEVRAARAPATSPHRSTPASSPSPAGSAVPRVSSTVPGRAGGTSATSTQPAARSSAAGASGSGSSSPRTSAAGTGAAGAAATSAIPSSSSSGPRIVAAEPVTEHRTASGSPRPVLLTAAAIVLLAGGAGWTTWQRRRLS